MKIEGNQTYWTPAWWKQTSLARTYPEIQTDSFHSSASHMQQLLVEATYLTDQIMTDDVFSKEIMEAAQVDDQEKVTTLLKGKLSTSECTVSYTPSGMEVKLDSPEIDDFSNLTLHFAWEAGGDI